MIQSGYLDFARWSNPRPNQNLPSRISRIRPSLQLLDKFTELSLSPLGIAHNYLQETVILTDYETDEEGNYTKSNDKKKRQYIDYDDIDFTKDIRRDLEA